jgi:hypothetical protein
MLEALALAMDAAACFITLHLKAFWQILGDNLGMAEAGAHADYLGILACWRHRPHQDLDEACGKHKICKTTALYTELQW